MQNWILLFFLFLFSTATFSQSQIDRIEPPNWWVGMYNPTVQLLVYGKDISGMTPSIDHEGVQIKKSSAVKNSNYLFIDLEIAETTKPAKIKIRFSAPNKKTIVKDWELLERKVNSAQRKGFDNSDVLYLITPDRFANGDPKNDDIKGMLEKANREFKGGRHGGDIEGIRQQLDYVADMGFTAIWLNPVLENDMPKYSYHGYATTDFYKVDSRFGSNESYQKLCKEAHSKDIKVIMDMIVNHCGSKHWWMEDQPEEDWLNNWEQMTFTNHGKTLTQDPYGAQSDRRQFFDGWFVKTMPDLNQRNKYMATYLIQNSIWWVEYGEIDGIRMDTYPYPEPSFMTEWTVRMMEEYPNFNIVGEEWNENPNIIAYWQKGKQNPDGYTSELPSLMDFPMQMSLTKALTEKETWGKGWISLYKVLSQDYIYPDPMNLVTFPDNHDMVRFYKQVNEDFDLFKMGLAYIATTRGIPQIYYGTEILMTSPAQRDDGIIRSDFPGGWKGDNINAFTGEGLTTTQLEAKAFTKKLLQWRKTSSAVQIGKLLHFMPRDGVYVYFRFDKNQKIMVVLNKNEEPYNLNLGRFSEILSKEKSGTDILTGKAYSLSKELQLEKKGPLILSLK